MTIAKEVELTMRQNTRVSLARIAALVCEVCDVSIKHLRSKRRFGFIADAKRIFVNVAYTYFTTNQIAFYLKKRCHSTILHHIKMFKDIYDTEQAFRNKYHAVIERL